MVNKIYEAKNRFLDLMDSKVEERGIDRVDLREMGDIADIVKDLAEAEEKCWKAEYYKAVTEAMETYGNSYSGRISKASPSHEHRSEHDDAMEKLRDMLRSANPDDRERLRNEVRTMMGAM